MIKTATMCSGIGSPEQALKFIIYKAIFPNRKCYIGLTRKGLTTRKYEHLYRSKIKYNLPFYHAINKYEWDSLVWIVLGEYETLKEAEQAEIRYIQEFPDNYNVSEGGNAGVINQETRQKISKALKGRAFTEEWKAKISDTLKIRFAQKSERDLLSSRAKIEMWRPDARENYLKGRLLIDKEKLSENSKATRAKKRLVKYEILSSTFKDGMNWEQLHSITGISLGFIRKYRKEWLSN